MRKKKRKKESGRNLFTSQQVDSKKKIMFFYNLVVIKWRKTNIKAKEREMRKVKKGKRNVKVLEY